jgi:Fe2+ transport system protein FeoA
MLPAIRCCRVLATGEDGLWEKMFESMGIRKGRRMRKIACQPFGRRTEVDGAKISMGQKTATKIEVEVLSKSPSLRIRPRSPPVSGPTDVQIKMHDFKLI